jgi:transcriptional regulator
MMYNKPDFAISAAASAAIIDAHPLAQLVVTTPDGLQATPVPLVRRGDSLVGHVARANEIWRHPGHALAIFTGPDTYVSPNWYPSKKQHGRVVPTWNYTTVHVTGTLHPRDEVEWKLDLVTLLTDTFEARQPRPWRVADAPSDHITALMQRIVGIEVTDLLIDGKCKLSQNQSVSDQEGVRGALASGDAGQRSVAIEMQDRS